jgi:putative heme-binding domain-containing protein
MKGDPQRGKQVFLSTCASCHHFGTNGGSVGPDLTKIAEKFDEKNLLDAIIHPNASIVFGYEPWLITTKNGATVYGLLQSDGKNVVLKDPSGKQIVIPATDIVSRKKTRTLMPDPETLQLSNEKLADLTAYLMTAGGK